MIDWDKPIVAVSETRRIKVKVDTEYARKPNATPVKFPVNLWVDGQDGGTWYFTDDGQSIGGFSETGGNNARYYLENVT